MSRCLRELTICRIRALLRRQRDAAAAAKQRAVRGPPLARASREQNAEPHVRRTNATSAAWGYLASNNPHQMTRS